MNNRLKGALLLVLALLISVLVVWGITRLFASYIQEQFYVVFSIISVMAILLATVADRLITKFFPVIKVNVGIEPAPADVVQSSLYCCSESVYPEHIRYGQQYKIEAINSAEGNYRVKGEKGRLVWLPDICFSKTPPPAIKRIEIYDEIRDPKNDSIEVSITFKDESTYIANFVTPQYLSHLLESNPYMSGNQLIICSEASAGNIHETINQLLRDGDLLSVCVKV